MSSGRGRFQESFNVSMTATMREELDQLAADRGLTPQELVRFAVAAELPGGRERWLDDCMGDKRTRPGGFHRKISLPKVPKKPSIAEQLAAIPPATRERMESMLRSFPVTYVATRFGADYRVVTAMNVAMKPAVDCKEAQPKGRKSSVSRENVISGQSQELQTQP